MPRAQPVQFNVRSAFARARARELAEQTGMTATEVVEDALRGYVPPVSSGVGRLVRRGPLLVLPAAVGRTVSLKEAEAILEAVREGN
ncbi:MAG: hypothetical protein ABI056_02540 [Caulobacteraceae bacterium]